MRIGIVKVKELLIWIVFIILGIIMRIFFLDKDVGNFPRYSSVGFTVVFLFKGRSKYSSWNNLELRSISSIYLLGLFQLVKFIKINRPRRLYIFHIGLKNLLPIFLCKLVSPETEIVCKSDLNIATASYLVKQDNFGIDWIRKKLYEYSYSRIDILTVETGVVYEKIANLGWILNGAVRLKLLHNGLDDEFSSKLAIVEKRNVITVITRFDSIDKSPERIFDLLNNLKIPKDWAVNVIGPIPDTTRERLVILADKNGINLNLLGVLDRDGVKATLMLSSIFLCYSSNESFCISLIEAAACANHVVTTNVGVARDLEKYYSAIDVVDIYQEDMFFMKVTALLASMDSKTLAEQANIVRERFSWRYIAKNSDLV